MTARSQHPINAPQKIILTLLAPEQIVQPGDVIAVDGFYHPCSLAGVTANSYDVPLYRPSLEEATEVAA